MIYIFDKYWNQINKQKLMVKKKLVTTNRIPIQIFY